ncbi:hypothetical protein BV20DRAFT_1054153 [Pilatotrama ljubarskyi]|nr:hypothetical protein BV20DRAFT_1054153 [Pilatotrama ljubarskyi]
MTTPNLAISLATRGLQTQATSIPSSSTLALHAAAADSQRRTWRQPLAGWEANRVKLDKREPGFETAQLKRTETWQFMPVNYASTDGKRPLAVADELESFVHLLLFSALRCLPNNLIPNPETFIAEYFKEFEGWKNPYREPGGPWHCSLPKYIAIVRGCLMSSYGPDVLFTNAAGPEEGDMLNYLIEALLNLFHARYEVLEHKATRERIEAMARTASLRTNSAAAVASAPHISRMMARRRNHNRSRPWHPARDDPDTTGSDRSVPKAVTSVD